MNEDKEQRTGMMLNDFAVYCFLIITGHQLVM